MPRNNQGNSGRGGNSNGNNNNPEGRNQFSGGFASTARERPIAAAAVTAAAVGAGVFLWSRRNQISEQIANLSDQIGDWTANKGSSGQGGDFEYAGGSGDLTASSGSTGGSSGRSQREISEEALSLKDIGSTGGSSGISDGGKAKGNATAA